MTYIIHRGQEILIPSGSRNSGCGNFDVALGRCIFAERRVIRGIDDIRRVSFTDWSHLKAPLGHEVRPSPFELKFVAYHWRTDNMDQRADGGVRSGWNENGKLGSLRRYLAKRDEKDGSEFHGEV